MIGEKINQLRKQRKLTLSELAGRANISKSYLSNIERNLNQNPSIQIIEKIAQVLEVDPSYLFNSAQEISILEEQEWVDFLNDLRSAGIEKEDLEQYKMVIEFINWKNKRVGK